MAEAGMHGGEPESRVHYAASRVWGDCNRTLSTAWCGLPEVSQLGGETYEIDQLQQGADAALSHKLPGEGGGRGGPVVGQDGLGCDQLHGARAHLGVLQIPATVHCLGDKPAGRAVAAWQDSATASCCWNHPMPLPSCYAQGNKGKLRIQGGESGAVHCLAPCAVTGEPLSGGTWQQTHARSDMKITMQRASQGRCSAVNGRYHQTHPGLDKAWCRTGEQHL